MKRVSATMMVKKLNAKRMNKITVESVSGLRCDECSVWFHAGCEGLSEELCKILKKEKVTLWLCYRCKITGVKK